MKIKLIKKINLIKVEKAPLHIGKEQRRQKSEYRTASTVSNWVNEFQKRRSAERKLAFKQLHAQRL